MRQSMIVRSRAGRDKNEWFAVISVQGDFAWVANGKSRPLSRPKRKRLKHLAPTAQTLAPWQLATDRQLRLALSKYAACCDKEVSDLGEG
jgi:ribosomal protein L14E/L6E/L27E